MITGLKIHTEEGVLHVEDASESYSTAAFLADLIAATHKTATQSWVLRDSGASGRALQPELTLQQNGVGKNHNLYLVAANGAVTHELDLQIVAPDGQALQFQVRSSTKVSLLLSQVPGHFGLEPVDNRGKPVLWVLVVERTGVHLDRDKTLGENGLVKRARLLLQREVVVPDLVLDTLAPNGQSTRKEVPPGTLGVDLVESLVVQLELPKTNHAGDVIEWFLLIEKSKKRLDSGRSLVENGVETGDRLLLDTLPGACLVLSVRTAEKGSRQLSIPGDTPVAKFIETVVVTFGLQQKASDGRPHLWILAAPGSRALDPAKTLAGVGVRNGEELTLLLTSPKLRLEVSVPNKGTSSLEKPGEFSTSALVQELISGLKLPAKDERKHDIRWILRRPGSLVELDASKSLKANGIEDGDKLALSADIVRPAVSPAIWLLGAAVLVILGVVISLLHSRQRVVIEVSPTTITLPPGEVVVFRALTQKGSAMNVRWAISPAIGSITQQGVYTAPSNLAAQASLKVIATSLSDSSVSGDADVTLLAAPTAVQPAVPEPAAQVAPGENAVPAQPAANAPAVPTQPAPAPKAPQLVPQNAPVGGAQRLQLALRPIATSNVRWSINPQIGNISAGGLYTAPPVIAQASIVTVSASVAGSFSSTSKINLQPVLVGPITVAPGPNRTYVAHGSISNSNNKGIVWSINPQFGSISPDGVYTPPAVVSSARTIEVIATSTADPSKSAHVDIPLPANISVKVGINTHSPVLMAGQHEQLSATVTGSSNTGVTWSSSGVGSISPFGVYSAPASVPAGESTVRIWATSNVDSKQVAATVITVRPAPAYAGPTSGVVIWKGNAGKNDTIKITNGGPGVSGTFPGVPVDVTPSEKVQILDGPSLNGGWETVTVKTQAKEKTISISWKVKAAAGR